jgi:Dna[CI] antecedent, DciA
MSARALTTFIQAEPALKPLLRRLSELSDVQRLYTQNVPPSLAKLGQAGSFRDGTLIIFAENGAAAAKLKQALPEVTHKISQTLQEPIEIRVSVQVDAVGRKTEQRRYKAPMSPEALRSLRTLADKLRPSPLKTEIGHLITRQTRITSS